jgi:fibronectin type 3 domain-containing protein
MTHRRPPMAEIPSEARVGLCQPKKRDVYELTSATNVEQELTHGGDSGLATAPTTKGNSTSLGPTSSLAWSFHPQLVLLAAVALAGWLRPAPLLASSTIAYVQGNDATPQSPQTTVNVTFTAAQAAGDLNVVVVGWFDTTAVVSKVTDTSGNTYALAVGPTIYSSPTEPLSQSIYYAKNIVAAAAGANSVTVTFSTAASYPDIRILEYSGAAPNYPVDVTAASSGTSNTSSSGSATTINPTDLLFGANTVWTSTTGPGSGFTQRLLTNYGDIAEDEMVTTSGSYTATAPLSSSGPWVMQMVAFRAVVPSYGLSVSPNSLSVAPGNQGTSTITTKVVGGFSSLISLSASGAPAGTTVSFSPSTITGAGSTTMTVTVESSTAGGTYPLTITANGGGIEQSATVWLSVTVVSYVQGNYAIPRSPQTTVTISFTNAQAAGDLNVVVVGWNDTTAAVSTVTDTSGNSYALAVGPTAFSGYLTQSIYYAKNIVAAAAGANVVTVTFSPAASYPDIRILEYSGADPNNPVDVTAAGSGSSSTSSSGSATTTNATDLIFGANIVYTLTTGPGSGFTQRLLTPEGDIVEDEMVTATGSYSASAPLSSSGPWVMEMVAFRTPAATVQGSYKVSASPNSLSVARGGQGTSTITTTVTGGFSSVISLSASGAPAGTTVSFSPSTITAAGSSAMTVTVGSSTAAGTYSLTVMGSGGGQSATVSLSVLPTTIVASPTSVNFGNVVVGSSSTLPVILTNTGTGSVTISQDSVTGTGFSISGPTLPLTLSAGQNTDFSVTFAPTAGGSVTGSASILSNATNSPGNELLSGTGIHAVSLSWTASTSTVTGYNVFRGTQSGGPYTMLNSSLLSGTTYTDTTVQAGQTYYYVTTAVNSADVESQYSNQVQAVVPSP